MTRAAAGVVLAAAVAVMSACARVPPAVTPGAPVFPDLIEPVAPPDIAVPPAVVELQGRAWQRLQQGDVAGAGRDFSTALRQAPAFVPAQVGVGDVALVQKKFDAAIVDFGVVLRTHPAYVPALSGLADAYLGAGDQAHAIAALQLLLAADPARESAARRLGVLRLRAVEQEMNTAAAARAAGRLDEAQAAYERALLVSPGSGAVLRLLAAVELARGALDDAERHARAAVAADGSDAEADATLGDVLDARGRAGEAGDAFQRAVTIDPRPAWRARVDALRAKANLDALPPDYRAIPTARTVTRAQVAAYVDRELARLLDRAPALATAPVVVDVGHHWAEASILRLTRAGVMDVQPNHTFQPDAIVHRADLARVVQKVLGLLPATRAKDLAAWRAARPKFADMPPDHAAYLAAAAATASGAMALDGDRFSPTRPVTGPELAATVARLGELAGT